MSKMSASIISQNTENITTEEVYYSAWINIILKQLSRCSYCECVLHLRDKTESL